MKCIDCRFYEAHETYDAIGFCKISLPPHLHESANNFQSMAKADAGCDLGQAAVQVSVPVKEKASTAKKVEEAKE